MSRNHKKNALDQGPNTIDQEAFRTPMELLRSSSFPAHGPAVYPVAKNPFETLYVDLTYKCNMACQYCYNPVRELPDLDLEYFRQVSQQLPRTTLLRLLGGEPTLHPQFFEFLQVARESSNESCAKFKLAALENLAQAGFKRLCLSAIIVRNLNEDVIPDLISLCQKYKGVVRYLHLRTAAPLGRWNKKYGLPYTAPELKDLLISYIGEDAVNKPQRIIRNGTMATDGHGRPLARIEQGFPERVCRSCCYEFWLDGHLQIGLIEFGPQRASMCWRRGKLMRDYTVQPFFENMNYFSQQVAGGFD